MVFGGRFGVHVGCGVWRLGIPDNGCVQVKPICHKGLVVFLTQVAYRLGTGRLVNEPMAYGLAISVRAGVCTCRASGRVSSVSSSR